MTSQYRKGASGDGGSLELRAVPSSRSTPRAVEDDADAVEEVPRLVPEQDMAPLTLDVDLGSRLYRALWREAPTELGKGFLETVIENEHLALPGDEPLLAELRGLVTAKERLAEQVLREVVDMHPDKERAFVDDRRVSELAQARWQRSSMVQNARGAQR